MNETAVFQSFVSNCGPKDGQTDFDATIKAHFFENNQKRAKKTINHPLLMAHSQYLGQRRVAINLDINPHPRVEESVYLAVSVR